METTIDAIKYLLMFFSTLFVVYLVFRLLFAAVFRSYFETKKEFTNKNKEEDSDGKKG
jgi:hypothetical protein